MSITAEPGRRPTPSQTVFVVDDDANVGASLVRLLNLARFQAEAIPTPEALVRRLESDPPGCLVLDIRMPGMNGLDLYADLAEQGRALPAVFLSAYLDVGLTVRAMKAGAIDVLQKPCDRRTLFDAIRRALEADERRRAELEADQELQARFESLTPREKLVMTRVIEGDPSRQIAQELGTSEKTVKAHRGHVMRKFGVSRTADLVRLAQQLGVGRTRADN